MFSTSVMSPRSLVRVSHGIEVIHSMYVLTTVASGDIGDIFFRRSSSESAFFSASSLMLASSIACWSSLTSGLPSPSWPSSSWMAFICWCR